MQRALGERREGAHLLDLVAEELDAQRLAARRREDVDDPAADGELAALLGAVDALVAGERERLREAVEARLGADLEPDRRRRARTRAAIPSASAVAEAQTSPPRASTSRARARSPTRCGGGSRPEPQRTPRPGQQRDALGADEPARRLGGVARVGVLGQQADEAPLELLVQRREEERQDRLRDAGARRQGSRERLQALEREQLPDERVEYRDGP